MIIEFKKIGVEPKEFSLQEGLLSFVGEFKKDKSSASLVIIHGHINGKQIVSCDMCGVEFEKELCEEVFLRASNGIYERASEDDDEIVVEFFNQKIDFGYILESEVASIESDYHICKDCDK